MAHRLGADYPDGSLFVDMRGFSGAPPLRATDALARFLRALGVKSDGLPTDVDEQSALFRSVLAGRRVLLVFDNVANPQQVRPLLPSEANCAVMVTSRHTLHGLAALNGARRIPVDMVTPREATSLLETVLGARVGEESAAATELAAVCGHLPLALRIAAANVATTQTGSIAAYVKRLASESPVVSLSIDGDEAAAVEMAFELSYRTLDPEPARLFRLMSTIPGPDFDHYAAANLLQVGVADARRLLDQLVSFNLLYNHLPDRYHYHDLVRGYAGMKSAKVDSDEERRAVHWRVFDFYLHAADAAGRMLYPDMPRLRIRERPTNLLTPPMADPAAALSWFDAEAGNIEAMIHNAGDERLPVWLLADAMLGYFDRQRHDTPWLAVFTAALAAAERFGNGHGRAAMCRGLGKLHYLRSEYGHAGVLYQRAVEAFREVGDVTGEGRALNGVACVSVESGHYDAAIPQYEQALETTRAAQDPVGRADVLVNLGTTMVLVGRDDEGVRRLVDAADISRGRALGHVQPRVCSGVGLSDLWRGRLIEAADAFGDALAAWRELRYRQGQAMSLRNLAEVYLEAGRIDRAYGHAEEALTIAEDVGARWMAMGAVVTLGQAHLDRCEVEAATEHFVRAEQLYAADLQYWHPFMLLGLAACTRLAGEAQRALDLAATTVTDVRPRVRGQAHRELARAELMLGNGAAAKREATAALEIARHHGYVLDEARALDLCADVASRAGSDAQARRYAGLARTVRGGVPLPG